MSYAAPVRDMVAILRGPAGLDRAVAKDQTNGFGVDDFASVLDEAARFAGEVIAPLNRIGDENGARFEDGRVATAPGFKEAYKAWAEGGWNALAGPEEFGGQGLPHTIAVACTEMWNSGSLAFALGPLLTIGAVEALEKHGSHDLKQHYLPKLVSGEWTGTMNLTEPQAGSDLAALRAKAERNADGSYRITGTKIFITYGEHDMTDNIVHLVLARLPDAPAGTRGISLFLVPKVLPDGRPNDVRCAGIEHKLGIHASPTCVMVFGDEGGAAGWLIGEENRGLACMFTMMNSARLNVAVQGVAVAERAYQQALAYARERKQGRAPGASGAGMSPIFEHPDIRRMLLTMKSQTMAARAISYLTAACLDLAARSPDAGERARAAARASLLTPVAKAFATDTGNEVASLGVQIHGGMGFVEETGAAQHMRDARILPIYEGTNGIQAIDLVTRKLPLDGGEIVAAEIAAMRATVKALMNKGESYGASAARLRDAVESLDRATAFMKQALAGNDPGPALAGATPYLRLFALARGGTLLADLALAENADASRGHIALCRFFAENVVPAAAGLGEAVLGGAGFLEDAGVALAG